MEHPQDGKKQWEPRLTIRVSAATHKALKRVAVERETSVQALVTPLLEDLAGQDKH